MKMTADYDQMKIQFYLPPKEYDSAFCKLYPIKGKELEQVEYLDKKLIEFRKRPIISKSINVSLIHYPNPKNQLLPGFAVVKNYFSQTSIAIDLNALKWYLDSFVNTINDNMVYHSMRLTLTRGVYVLYLGDSNWCYIGKTEKQTFIERFEQHRQDLERGQHPNYRVQKAFDRTQTLIPFIYNVINDDKVIEETESRLIELSWANNYNIKK
jgi:hypothetical protein